MPSRLADAVAALRYRGRNWRYHDIFDALAARSTGDVVDVGGGHVADLAVERGLTFTSWTVVEPDPERFPETDDPRVRRITADGLDVPLDDGVADTVVSIQVLEHVFEPVEMLRELRRICRPGGHLLVVVPQTANVHELPHHYQNFTRFWLEEAARRLDLEIVDYRALGGAWSSIASRLVFHWATLARVPGHHDPRARRSWRAWAVAPFAALATAVFIPVSLALSFGDLDEEANNHLVVFRRP